MPPWEKYQSQASGPWTKYASGATSGSAFAEQGEAAKRSLGSPTGQPLAKPLAERVGNNLAGIAEGAMDPVHGAAQMLYNATPASIRNAVNAANNAVAPFVNRVTEPLGLHMQTLEGPEAMNEMVAQREANLKKAGITAPSRFVGNVLSPVNAIIPGAGIAGKAGMVAKVGGGAASGAIGSALQPVTDDETTVKNYWEKKAGQAGTGAALGGTLGTASSVISGLHPGKAAKVLLKEKINLTPGQIAGGVARSVEEKFKSIPFIGEQIAAAEGRALQSFNRVTINKALSPLGKSISKETAIGNDAIAEGQKVLGDAYDSVLPKISFRADKPFAGELQKTLKKSAEAAQLPQTNRTQLESFLKDRIYGPLSEQGGVLDGKMFKQIESELGDFARNHSASGSPGDRNMGKLAARIRDTMRSAVERQNPEVAKELQNINKSYSMFTTIENAAGRRVGSEGVFSPHDLMASVKSSDRSVRHRAFSAGRAKMQGWAKNGMSVLPNRVPDSGTAGRGAVAGLAAAALGGQIPVVGPALAGTMATGLAAYSRPGVAGLRGLMTAAPETRAGLSALVNRAIPGSAGASSRLLAEEQ